MEPAEQPGEILHLARRLRARSVSWDSLRVSLIIAEAAARWRRLPDPLTSSDELPVAAWIVRRKSESLFPVEAPVPEPGEDEPETDSRWVVAAVGLLQERWDWAQRVRTRPQQPVNDAAVPSKVWDASAERLRAAWPPVRPSKPRRVPRVIARDGNPVEAWMERLWRALTTHPRRRATFRELVGPTDRAGLVTGFVALLALQQMDAVRAEQKQPFGPIDLIPLTKDPERLPWARGGEP